MGVLFDITSVVNKIAQIRAAVGLASKQELDDDHQRIHRDKGHCGIVNMNEINDKCAVQHVKDAIRTACRMRKWCPAKASI
jgi:hypothetical protein